MAKPPKRIHRPPPVDGMAACIVLQKGKWQRMQVACHPVDAEAVSQLLSGCGPKCVTDFVKNGPKKIQKKKKKQREFDFDDDFGEPIFGWSSPPSPAATAVPAAPPPPASTELTFTAPIKTVRGKVYDKRVKIPGWMTTEGKKKLQKAWDDLFKTQKGPLTPEDERVIGAAFDAIVAKAVKSPVIDVTPSNPAAESNPTGNVSGLSSRRPTMARRKACSVLRRQGKKLPKRCKGTKRKSRR